MKNFCFSIFLVLTLSACSTMEFNTSGTETFFVNAKSGSEELITVEKTKSFYFWGLSPEHPDFDLQDETQGKGLYNPSYVTIEQSYKLKDIVFTFMTLGLYCPVTYKVTLLSNKGLK